MGRPQTAERSDVEEEPFVAEANGNGVEHHSPLKSNTGSTERQEPRKPELSPAAAMSMPSTDDTIHENVNGDARLSTEKARAEVSKDLSPEQCLMKQQEETAKEASKRMFFPRIPKQTVPQSQQQALQDKIAELRKEAQEVTDAIDSTLAARDVVRNKRDATLDTLRDLRELIIAKEVEIEPHVAERNKHSEAAKAASLAKKQNALDSRVQFRTEEALNAALRAVEYRYAHETNPKAEEDALYKQIKKLEGQRSAVRAVEAKDRARAAAASEVARAEPEMSSAMSAKEANVLVEALIAEKRALVADSKALSDVFEAYKAEANALDEQVKELRTRRSLLKRKQDELTTEMRGLGGFMVEQWQLNRRFSQQVRLYLKEGRVDFARQQCAQKTEHWMNLLANDAKFREEYHRLWKEERGVAKQESVKGTSDNAVDVIARALSGVQKVMHEKQRVAIAESAKGPKNAAEGPKVTAEGPKAAADASAEAPAHANGHTSEPEQPEAVEAPELHKTLGAMQMEELAQLAENGGVLVPAKAKAPRRSKAVKKSVVEIPAIFEDKTPFVPPAALLKRDVEQVDEAEERERARLRNAEAAREAEARKERKRRKAEQKERAQKVRDAHKAAGVKEDDKAAKEPAALASEELPAAATAAEVPATPAPASAAAAAVPKPSGGGGKPSGRVGKHIGAPVAKSRVQVNRRKGTLQRVLAYAQQQLPKSLMHRVLVGVLLLLGIWLLTELLPRPGRVHA